MKTKLDLNPGFKKALRLLEDTDEHLFITGRAGNGKSTLLQHWFDQTKKDAVVLAPTGVAALNVRGETIHSFFGFRPDVTVKQVRKRGRDAERAKLIQKTDTIVIDEASMVRADLLDCIDQSLRIHGRRAKHLPFGGKQMVFIGDLHQLPPVVPNDQQEIFRTHYATPYFFSAHVYVSDKLMGIDDPPELRHVELKKIYRQSDQKFIEALNGVRDGSAKKQHLDLLNSRVDYGFEPNPRQKQFWIHLTTTNARANAVNARHLDRLRGKQWTHEATVKGNMSERSFPTHQLLELKKGAQVMFVSNDPEGRFVNGTVGRVAGFEKQKGGPDLVFVELEDGELVEVGQRQWEAIKWEYDDKSKSLDTEVVGSFTQYPLRLAWAVTIHKSQGKTFDRVVLDLGGRVFASGQTYVALSRCRTLDGLVLKQPIRPGHMMVDRRVNAFLRGQDIVAQPSKTKSELGAMADTIENAINEGCALRMGYIGADGVATERVVAPQQIGEITFNTSTFTGFRAHCFLRGQSRVFKLDRVATLEMVDIPE